MSARKDVGEISVIKNQAGDILTEAENMEDRWREYFCTLLNVENQRDLLTQAAVVEGPITQVTREEVKEAVEKTKTGKAAGCSGVRVDLNKVLKELENEKVTKLLEAIWVEESIPFEWENSETVLIYRKKDDPLDCGNYLGIKLLEHQLKVLECILDQRLRKIINQH